MSQFPIVPTKTGLLFFDTLNRYLHPEDPDSRAAVKRSGIVGAMQKMSAAARAAGIAVFYAQAAHRPDRRDFARQVVDRGHRRTSDGPYLTSSEMPTAGSNDLEVIPELAPQPDDYVIKKQRWSAFYQTNLELCLRTRGIDTILLAGGSTEVGVASTAYAARDQDFNLVILRDAVRSGGGADLDAFFFDHVFPVFARVMTVDEVIAAIPLPSPAEGDRARS